MLKQMMFVSSLFFLFSSQTFAQLTPEQRKERFEKQLVCNSFVRFDSESLYLGAEQNSVRVVSLTDSNREVTITTDARPLDAVRFGDSLWILTVMSLEEWSLGTFQRIGIYPTTAKAEINGNWEAPTSFALYKRDLVISHGIRGTTIFNLDRKVVTREVDLNSFQAPLLSTASGVTVAGSKAYFVLDDVTMVQPGTPPAFRGIIVYNLESQQIESKLDKMDAGADSVTTDGEKLFVSFMGMPVWKYALTTLHGTSTPTPEQRVWKFGREGHPTGRASVDEKFYYTCFYARQSRGQYTRIPVALDRKMLKLD